MACNRHGSLERVGHWVGWGAPPEPTVARAAPEIRHFTKRCRGREKGKEAAARHSPGESIVRGRARVVSEHVSERKITKSFVSRA